MAVLGAEKAVDSAELTLTVQVAPESFCGCEVLAQAGRNGRGGDLGGDRGGWSPSKFLVGGTGVLISPPIFTQRL